jgi:hypothetical protein
METSIDLCKQVSGEQLDVEMTNRPLPPGREVLPSATSCPAASYAIENELARRESLTITSDTRIQ